MFSVCGKFIKDENGIWNNWTHIKYFMVKEIDYYKGFQISSDVDDVYGDIHSTRAAAQEQLDKLIFTINNEG